MGRGTGCGQRLQSIGRIQVTGNGQIRGVGAVRSRCRVCKLVSVEVDARVGAGPAEGVQGGVPIARARRAWCVRTGCRRGGLGQGKGWRTFCGTCGLLRPGVIDRGGTATGRAVEGSVVVRGVGHGRPEGRLAPDWGVTRAGAGRGRGAAGKSRTGHVGGWESAGGVGRLLAAAVWRRVASRATGPAWGVGMCRLRDVASAVLVASLCPSPRLYPSPPLCRIVPRAHAGHGAAWGSARRWPAGGDLARRGALARLRGRARGRARGRRETGESARETGGSSGPSADPGELPAAKAVKSHGAVCECRRRSSAPWGRAALTPAWQQHVALLGLPLPLVPPLPLDASALAT